MLLGKALAWHIRREVLPTADARHQLDCEQIREAKDWFGLTLAIGVQRVRANPRAVLQQAVEDIDRFPHPAGNEAAEQGDVGV